MRILMVCLGNICRSPLAEGILQKKALEAGLNWLVESAGTLSFHAGEMPHSLSCAIALENGLDITQQRARQFRKDDMHNFDLIYAMAMDVLVEMQAICPDTELMQKTRLLLDELHPGQNMDVPDPYGGTPDDFRNTYRLIEAACQVIIDKALKETVTTYE